MAPSDVERLDYFICAVHRYRAILDLDALVAHLIQQCQWSESDAEKLRNRILIGGKVLAANKRF